MGLLKFHVNRGGAALSLSPSGLRAPFFFKRFRPVGGAINNVAIAVEAVARAEK